MTQKSIYLVYPSRRQLPSKITAFIDFVLERVTPEPPWEIAFQNVKQQRDPGSAALPTEFDDGKRRQLIRLEFKSTSIVAVTTMMMSVLAAFVFLMVVVLTVLVMFRTVFGVMMMVLFVVLRFCM